MENIFISPGIISGKTTVASSKSQTIRAMLFASLAEGISIIQNPLFSSDIKVMIKICRMMGAKIKREKNSFLIEGVKGEIKPFSDIVDVRNSGLILRFLAAIAANLPFYTIFTGDASIKHLRHSLPLIEGMQHLGGLAISLKADGKAPLIIKGPLKGKYVKVQGEDSQNVSAMIIANALRENNTTVIEVENPQEKPYIDMTLFWLDKLKIPYKRKRYDFFEIKGVKTFDHFTYHVPSDPMSASYLAVAAIITKSKLCIENISLKEEFDIHWLRILKKMGADIKIEKNSLHIFPSRYLRGGIFDINASIDALPLFAVLGCFAKEKVILKNCAIARKKESDRLNAITQELKKMKARIEQKEDCLIIYPSSLKGACVFSHRDHRIAMSLAIAALAAKGKTKIQKARIIGKSFPYFVETIQKLGGEIQWII